MGKRGYAPQITKSAQFGGGLAPLNPVPVASAVLFPQLAVTASPTTPPSKTVPPTGMHAARSAVSACRWPCTWSS